MTLDPKRTKPENDTELTQYIIYSVVGLLLCVGICFIVIYCTLKRTRNRRMKSKDGYDSQRQNSLDPRKQTKHKAMPSASQQYQMRKEMEIAQIMMLPIHENNPNKLNPERSTSPKIGLEKVDTLDAAAAKPLPISRPVTYMKTGDDEYDEDEQIITKDSTIYYDPTEDAKIYGGNAKMFK